MPEVTLEWLNKQAKQLVKKHWGLDEIPKITIDMDRKDLDWKSAVGYYCSDIKTIAFSSEVNERRTERAIKRTLLHELCHWHLHATGQPYHDSNERFARELIRVGLGRRHNRDEKATLAAKIARKEKESERFEIIERNEDTIITIRLKHHRKNVDDFKKDLANTLISAHNNRDEDEQIYPGDIADMMCKWYGYKKEPIAKIAVEISESGSYRSGQLADRDDLVSILTNDLDVDLEEAEKNLIDHVVDDYCAASEDVE
ncbi:hypothetical protein G9G63_09245 [Paenibacillus sp. EKM202P]|uniref:SprT-like domain-containing protein n=1 Tax=unclassified Paenibacillus TaxID=185978 RepID=UPI0013EA997D|nr:MULTISPECIES: SprT-like domain-containing protein [unclassified Paenibacillus]KAF6565335.1 hypothetical protein G9G63_09245 [Paenibacillus sp. EKM202P]KAF6569339.1 hypothetical protein G9G64_12845 [Paenibacillus sp. EKM207P]